MSAETPADVIEQAAKVIMRHFNPSPDGSWRLNPSEAARDLRDAGLLADPASTGSRMVDQLIREREECKAAWKRAEAARDDAIRDREHADKARMDAYEIRNAEFKAHQETLVRLRVIKAAKERAEAEVAELRATVERVRRETAMDWAGYFRTADSAVGWPTLTIARVIELLESGHEPFGCSAALGGSGQQ